MQVSFHELGSIDDQRLSFAVIGAQFAGQWVFVRHRERQTWEIPGGHREAGEAIAQTAARELVEETGASDFTIEPLSEYSVMRGDQVSYGRLFLANIRRLGSLPESEIGQVELFRTMPSQLTYPLIQPFLHAYLEAAARRLPRQDE
ncbi:MAG: NUDIX hydrolase [Bacillota bacterium]